MTYCCLQDVITFRAAAFDTTFAYVSCISCRDRESRDLNLGSKANKMYRLFFSSVESYLFDRSWWIVLFIYNKREILNGADCFWGAMTEIVGLFSSHTMFVAPSIGLRAYTTSSALEMEYRCQTLFLIFNERTGQNGTFIKKINLKMYILYYLYFI